YDLLLLNDQWRRERHNVAGHPDQEALFEAIDKDIIGTRTDFTFAGAELDPSDEPDRSYILNVRQPSQRVHGFMPILLEGSRSREKLLILIEVESGYSCGTCDGMA